MQKFALVCLLALAISTVYCGSSSSSGSSEGKRNKKQKDCSEDLVEETGPSGECMLIESLYNCSSQLTDPADILIFNQFIFELNFTLFASNNYTSFDIVSIASFKIKKFFLKYSHFQVKFKYFQIGSWGCFADLFQVGIQIADDKCDSVLEVNESGNFSIIISLQKYRHLFPNKAAFDLFIEYLLQLLSSTEIDINIRMTDIYVLIQKFTVDYPECKSILMEIEIEGFYSFEAFFEISCQYYRATQVTVLLNGSPLSFLYNSLLACVKDTTIVISTSGRQALKAFLDRMTFVIQMEGLSIQQKMKLIMKEYHIFCKTYGFLKQILLNFQISAEFGCFEDFINMFLFCESQNCWPEKYLIVPSTVAPSTTESITTTEAVTTTEVITTLVPTTTYEPYSGGCSHAASNVLTVDASGFSVIYTSSTTQMTGWTISEKNVWKNFCVKFTLEVINDNTAFPTAALKITEIISRINAYVVYYATRKTKVYSIKIGIWGSIEQLCGC